MEAKETQQTVDTDYHNKTAKEFTVMYFFGTKFSLFLKTLD